jgi:hypothetical protein
LPVGGVARAQSALFEELSALMGQPTTPLSAVVGTALKQTA